MAHFRDYSFRNVMLIVSQRPDATLVAGFNAWRRVGRCVKKGEKGIGIIAPMPFAKRDERTGEVESLGIGFRAVHVFDVSQTDGDALPEVCDQVTGDPAHHLPALHDTARRLGIVVERVEHPGAKGASLGGRIQLDPLLSPADEFSVLAHELAHELLHQGDSPRREKAVRELEADAVSFVLGTAIGLRDETARDYIHLCGGDVKMFEASLDRIQKTAARLLDHVLGYEGEKNESAPSLAV
jgi:hypothetical protein